MSLVTSVPLLDEQLKPMVWPGGADVRRTDPVTSHAARDSITGEGARGSREHVLEDLRLYGRSAAWEVEERAEIRGVGFSPSRLRTALSDLFKCGLVVRFSGTGVTPRGRRCDEFEVAS